MPSNVAPEEPSAEAGRDKKADRWHKRSDLVQIIAPPATLPIACQSGISGQAFSFLDRNGLLDKAVLLAI
jgi:hypothetical protein